MDTRVIASRYAVLEEIGRGGMGVVWLAEDRTIGRRVAIKELHLPDGVPAQERAVLEERVLREARAAGRLNDPAVVTVHDVVQEAGGTYIVMELIEAPTLTQIVARQGPLAPEAVARLAEQVLTALTAAHAAGVVHRDVKPSNIMVSATGRVKLTDFGIAQSVDDPRLTSSGVLVGSPSYLAPERIQGGDADARSDLWSLAAVLFFAVEGRSPFERASTAATLHAILNEVPYLTRCHGPLAAVIAGLLNPIPAARPGAEQVRELLAQATQPATGEVTVPTTAPAPGSTVALNPAAPVPGSTRAMPAAGSAPAGRPVRRRWLIVSAAVLAALALFAGGLFTGRLTGAAATDRPAAMDTTLTYGTGGEVPKFAMAYVSSDGKCLFGPVMAGQSVNHEAEADCAEPHGAEIFDWRTIYGGSEEYGDDVPEIDHPGAEPLAAYAERLCELTFGSGMVTAKDKAESLRYRALVPAPGAWPRARTVYCVLYRADGGQLTGSVVRN